MTVSAVDLAGQPLSCGCEVTSTAVNGNAAVGDTVLFTAIPCPLHDFVKFNLNANDVQATTGSGKFTYSYVVKAEDTELNMKAFMTERDVYKRQIVELETKLPEDKANAASVFYNRIAQNMPLQSDITVDYALGKKHAVLTEEQTKIDSPYNTYQNLGLPVGPICSPGKSSIDAAINPAQTNYLFFVADMDSGKLYFNETLEGHNADVQKYMGD